VEWEKGHGRLERRRLARVATTPEESGLRGCWQVIRVERQWIDLDEPEAGIKGEILYYATSLALQEHDDKGMEEIVRGHWSAIENGTHHRRDTTLREDSCRVAHRAAAETLAVLRNLAIGLFELEREAKRAKAGTLRSWTERQTFSTAWTVFLR
jgi:hypothetical protein